MDKNKESKGKLKKRRSESSFVEKDVELSVEDLLDIISRAHSKLVMKCLREVGPVKAAAILHSMHCVMLSNESYVLSGGVAAELREEIGKDTENAQKL